MFGVVELPDPPIFRRVQIAAIAHAIGAGTFALGGSGAVVGNVPSVTAPPSPTFSVVELDDPPIVLPGKIAAFVRSTDRGTFALSGSGSFAATSAIVGGIRFYGEWVYLIDENGDYVLDENGNRIITGFGTGGYATTNWVSATAPITYTFDITGSSSTDWRAGASPRPTTNNFSVVELDDPLIVLPKKSIFTLPPMFQFSGGSSTNWIGNGGTGSTFSTIYLVDEDGNHIIDENGNQILVNEGVRGSSSLTFYGQAGVFTPVPRKQFKYAELFVQPDSSYFIQPRQTKVVVASQPTQGVFALSGVATVDFDGEGLTPGAGAFDIAGTATVDWIGARAGTSAFVIAGDGGINGLGGQRRAGRFAAQGYGTFTPLTTPPTAARFDIRAVGILRGKTKRRGRELVVYQEGSVKNIWEGYEPGFRLTDGDDLNKSFAYPIWSLEKQITASVLGTVNTSVKLYYTVSNIGVASVPEAGVALPPAYPGNVRVVINNGANVIRVFAKDSSINGVPGDIGVTINPGGRDVFVAEDVYAWSSMLNTNAIVPGQAVSRWQIFSLWQQESALDSIERSLEIESDAWVDWVSGQSLTWTGPLGQHVQLLWGLSDESMILMWTQAAQIQEDLSYSPMNVTRFGLFSALVADDKMDAVQQGVELSSGSWVDYNAATAVNFDGELSDVVRNATGYSYAQMLTLWAFAKQMTPTPVGSQCTRWQLFKALIQTGDFQVVAQAVTINSDAWIIFNVGDVVSVGDDLGLLVQSTLGYTSAQMEQLWAQARTFIPE